MSDAEDDVSDAGLDGDFDDFDPLAVEDADGEPAPLAGQWDNDGDDDDDGDGDEEEAEAEAEAASDLGDGDASETRRARPRGRRPASEVRGPRPPAPGPGGAETRRRLIVAPEDRVTSNQLTLAEATRAVAIRAEQIAAHPNPYTDIGDLSDPKAIAQKELLDRRSPLLLYRDVGWSPAGERISEVWAVREMSYPPLN